MQLDTYEDGDHSLIEPNVIYLFSLVLICFEIIYHNIIWLNGKLELFNKPLGRINKKNV